MLPSKLVIEWPEDDKLDPNSKIPAGTTIGVYFSINDKLCCIRQFSWLLFSFNWKIKADRKKINDLRFRAHSEFNSS